MSKGTHIEELKEPRPVVPFVWLKRLIELETSHNELFEREEISKKERQTIMLKILGIKEMLEEMGIDVAKEVALVRKMI